CGHRALCILCSMQSSHFTPIVVNSVVFFLTDPATIEIHTLSLHDALPICDRAGGQSGQGLARRPAAGDHCLRPCLQQGHQGERRSEEHTSELQSRENLVCRLLLEKKKIIY